MRAYGNGEKDGEVKLWLSRELVELGEQHTDIVIGFIHPHYMRILWNSIPYRKYANYLCNQFFYN